MAKITHIDGSAPNTPGVEIVQPGYSFRRGKVVKGAVRGAWDQCDANGRPYDPTAAKSVLDESLGSNE